MDEILNRRSDVCEASAHIMTDAMHDDLVKALRQISDEDRYVLGELRKKGLGMDCWRLGKGLFNGNERRRYGHSHYAEARGY